MKLEAYQNNAVIINQNTDPAKHGVCGNDGMMYFEPPQARDQFMLEWLAMQEVAAYARQVRAQLKMFNTVQAVCREDFENALHNLDVIQKAGDK